MNKLLQRMRQTRELGIDIEGHSFTIIRPTVEQMVHHQASGASHLDLAKRYVVGWGDTAECDIVKGGSTEPLAFDRDVWTEWLADNPDWWIPIGDAVIDLYKTYADQKGDAVKN